MSSPIYVTGMGCISAIGDNVPDCLKALRTAQTGIGPINVLQTRHKGTFKVGEVKHSSEELLEIIGLPKSEMSAYTRTTLLGLIAAQEAIIDAGIKTGESDLKTALISATTVGGMDKTELKYGDSGTNLDYVHTHPSGDSTDKICNYLGISGYRTTLSTACSSGTNAIIHGIRLIKNGIVDRAIVGGTDALSKFTLNGFNSLMIFDKEQCKPFDNNRNGLNLGEAGAFIVIESEKSALARKKKPICKIAGFANANDAYHQTASSPEGEGAYLAMKEALTVGHLKPSQIDYINVHGTGTENNDLSEGVAIERLFGDDVPKFSSTKSFTGHTLGAAAAVEAVFSVLSIRHNLIYPNLNFSEQIAELNISPETELTETPVNYVLSNSFGFGGNNSSIIFTK